MSVSFARQTKLSNISGRADYISNPKRQENIVLHSKEHMKNDWKDYAKFENENTKSHTENNQGREIIIHLPHELANDKNKLKKVVDDYSKTLLGENRDFEYAVHWNKKESNLHAHILFSERERNIEREPKTYKKDMWYDKKTNRMAKANAPGSELRFKKGDIQRDKETGEIKYNDNPFSIKDKHFTTKAFNYEIKETHKNIMNKYGYDFRLFDPKKEVAQKHLGKRSSSDYLKYAEWWNRQANLQNQIYPLREKYYELKPLVEKYRKMNVEQARLNLSIYEHNGYAGNNWSKVKRLTYLASEKFADEENVKQYDELGSIIVDKMNDKELCKAIGWKEKVYPHEIIKFFKQLVKTINDMQENFLAKKENMFLKVGTLTKFKNYQSDLAKEKAQKHAKELLEAEKKEISINTLIEKQKQQRASKTSERKVKRGIKIKETR